MRSRLSLLALALPLAGCAALGFVPSSAPVPDEHESDPAPEGGAPPSAHKLPPLARRAGSPLAPPALERFDPRTIPGGLACLIRLRALGIDHVSLPALKGVDTPVRVTGPIGGLRFRSLGRTPLVCDCRLALALHRAAPFLAHLGVKELRYSSAYRYSLMPSGRLSQHAMGLALDVHRVLIGEELLDVEQDFVRGLEDGCSGPPLNRLACLLRARGLFDWVLTPDFDHAHRNHFHLDIYDLHRRRHVPASQPGPAIDD